MDGQVPYLITVHFELHFGYRYGILLPVQETDFKSEVLDFYGWFFIWKPYDKTLENRKKFSLRINLDKIISPIISQSKWSDQNDLNNNLIWPILKNVLTLMSLWKNRLFDDVFIKWPRKLQFNARDPWNVLIFRWENELPFFVTNIIVTLFLWYARGTEERNFIFWSPTKQD